MTKFGFIHIRVIISALLGLLALSLIFSSWYYRDDLFQTIYDPGEPFQTYSPPPAPDYHLDAAWLLRPDANIDPLTLTGAGGDVFVVAPTMFLGGSQWNAPIENEKYQHQLKRIVLPNYILPYKSTGRVYAPHYRQAALYSFLNNRDDGAAAQIFAYQDVKRAFGLFLAENTPERPIVLVGYGQGGLHVQRLLAEFFANSDRINRLAVAYVIDHPTPLENTGNIKPCTRKEDINCIAAFGAFAPNEKKRAQMFVQKTMVWTDEGNLRAVSGQPLLCVNPLLWSTGTDYAPARLHLGGVAAEGLDAETMPAPMPQQTGAQCQDGILVLDKPKQKALRRPSRFGGKYRTLPSNLFYEDVRVDAARRVQYLIDRNILPRRAPLLELDTIEVEDAPVTLPLKKYKKQ